MGVNLKGAVTGAAMAVTTLATPAAAGGAFDAWVKTPEAKKANQEICEQYKNLPPMFHGRRVAGGYACVSCSRGRVLRAFQPNMEEGVLRKLPAGVNPSLPFTDPRTGQKVKGNQAPKVCAVNRITLDSNGNPVSSESSPSSPDGNTSNKAAAANINFDGKAELQQTPFVVLYNQLNAEIEI